MPTRSCEIHRPPTHLFTEYFTCLGDMCDAKHLGLRYTASHPSLERRSEQVAGECAMCALHRAGRRWRGGASWQGAAFIIPAPLRHLLLFRVLHMRRLHMTKRRGAGGAAGAQRPQGEKQQGTSLNVSLKKRERLRHQNDRGAAEATERKCCAKE